MEENLYDTSKLIELYKKSAHPRGSTTILSLIEFPKAFDFDLRVFFPSMPDYDLALTISMELLKNGKSTPAIDLVIAAAALNNGFRIITRDKHFLFVKEIREDLMVVVEPGS